MTLESILSSWKSDPVFAPNITSWKILPSHPPTLEDFPPGISPELQDDLNRLGVHSLYKHQRQAWESLRSNHNIVLATGTASGKSLAYQLPILDDCYQGLDSTALLLFPTKALARDQLEWFKLFPYLKASAYDGDTPRNTRKVIRDHASLIITNPDMLHIGILPYHTEWIEFFSHLKYIVLDEIHIYRGIFGSHVANVLRRLKRLLTHYGASPQFVLTSATIGNPRSLSESLIEEKCQLIEQDFSPQGVKHFLIYNPPLIDSKLGLRASMQDESIRLASNLISAGLQTIIFGRSRRSVEFTLAKMQSASSLPNSSLAAYRSGYLPTQRREIESELRSGVIRGIAATSALELGIDIGGLDAAILAGYPGSIAATWQRAGRAGRKSASSLAILVTSSNPLDQFLSSHPQYIFDKNPENGLISPDNLLIALAHLSCAAYELPFDPDSQYGSFTVKETKELLIALTDLGKLQLSNGKYYWINPEFPAAAISLRSTSVDQIALRLLKSDNSTSPLGTIDYESSLWMVHPGAIYIQAGESYLVNHLDLDKKEAELILSSNDYFTEPEKQTDFRLLTLHKQEEISGGIKYLGDIEVETQVTGFKRINWSPYEILSREPLDLPSSSLNTMATWFSVSSEVEAVLREKGQWTSSPNQYGPDWENIRAAVLARDNHSCTNCGRSNSAQQLHVHHKIPLRSFSSLQEANQLSNLITLCPRCHQRAESIVRVNSAIHGLGYLMHNLAPLLLMCDPGDLGLYCDFQSPFGESRPTVLLHENIPAGIGFSKYLFDHIDELLEMSLATTSNCQCENGCPACVGPGGEKGSGGKAETIALLAVLTGKKQTH